MEIIHYYSLTREPLTLYRLQRGCSYSGLLCLTCETCCYCYRYLEIKFALLTITYVIINLGGYLVWFLRRGGKTLPLPRSSGSSFSKFNSSWELVFVFSISFTKKREKKQQKVVGKEKFLSSLFHLPPFRRSSLCFDVYLEQPFCMSP